MSAPVRLIDLIFPADANHHGTLFGGKALSHMDTAAFLAATRHGRRAFVTASCERVDFAAPGHIGEIIEAEGRVVRVGRTSLSVEVTLHAEALHSGERRLCTRGLFHMVAPGSQDALPPLPAVSEQAEADGDRLRMAQMVYPDHTNHYGTLFAGDALSLLGKAAFVAATRRARAGVVMAASQKIDFVQPIRGGDMIELMARVVATGRTSLTVEVELWSETLLDGERRRSAVASFVMVAVDAEGRPRAVTG